MGTIWGGNLLPLTLCISVLTDTDDTLIATTLEIKVRMNSKTQIRASLKTILVRLGQY